ncbi:hypothetical protein UFOVP274_59 [uncultured Caudovirales phage]|uniref:Uncharacterized protein n=1 Tax=uncultured Caudovirales phage TaxID=2100421 RepID=A0A6J5LP54_9CAUD|nr:hypothetical protein UFOVP274_59 [uncultured Caudovirales phage]
MNPFQHLIDLSNKPHQSLRRYHSLGGNKPQGHSISSRILDLLQEKKGMLLPEIMEQIGGKAGGIKGALKRLIARNQIKSTRLARGSTPGWYYIPGTSPYPPDAKIVEKNVHPLIVLLREHKTITQAQYIELTGANPATTKDTFTRMRSRGIIKTVKKTRTGNIYALEMGV